METTHIVLVLINEFWANGRGVTTDPTGPAMLGQRWEQFIG